MPGGLYRTNSIIEARSVSDASWWGSSTLAT